MLACQVRPSKWISDFTEPGAVDLWSLVRDDGQAALRSSTEIDWHRLSRLPVNANDPTTNSFTTRLDRDNAVAVRR